MGCIKVVVEVSELAKLKYLKFNSTFSLVITSAPTFGTSPVELENTQVEP